MHVDDGKCKTDFVQHSFSKTFEFCIMIPYKNIATFTDEVYFCFTVFRRLVLHLYHITTGEYTWLRIPESAG